MAPPLNIFSKITASGVRRKFSRRTSHIKKAPTKEELSEQTSLVSWDYSSHLGEDTSTATTSLCSSLLADGSASQRLQIEMSDECWKISKRSTKGSSMTIRFPKERDEKMVVLDEDDQVCAVVIQNSLFSGSLIDKYDYSMYTVIPLYEGQPPAIEEASLLLYSFARIQGERATNAGYFHCHRFSCRTESGQEFAVDKVVYSMLHCRAFCIRDAATESTVARITCLSEKLREILIYPKTDPALLLGFLAIMEEVMLLCNL